MEVLMTNFAKQLARIKHNDANIEGNLRLTRDGLIDKTVERVKKIEREYASNYVFSIATASNSITTLEAEWALSRMIEEISMIEDEDLELHTNYLENRIKNLQMTGRERDMFDFIKKFACRICP
jgi:hypothetical protein